MFANEPYILTISLLLSGIGNHNIASATAALASPRFLVSCSKPAVVNIPERAHNDFGRHALIADSSFKKES